MLKTTRTAVRTFAREVKHAPRKARQAAQQERARIEEEKAWEEYRESDHIGAV